MRSAAAEAASLGELTMSVDETICRYHLTADEATQQMLRLMPSGQRFVRSAVFAAATGVAMAFVPTMRPWGITLAVFALFWLFFFRRNIHRYVVDAVSQHPELLEAQTLGFGRSGFRISNSVSTLELPWERIRTVDDSGEFLLVRMDSLGSGAIVPKRAFTPDQLQQFMAYAASKTGRP